LGSHFIPPKHKNIPLILTHGSFDNHCQYPLPHLARFLANKGYITFRFDFRGCGNSDGSEEEYCLSSQMEDLEKVIDFIKMKTNKNKVGIIAKSISCIPSFIIASKRKDITMIIALGPPLHIDKYWSEEEVEEVKKRGYIFHEGCKYGLKYALEMRNLKKNYIESLKKIDIPTLLIVGENDKKVSLEEVKTILSLLKSEGKKMEIIKNADHSFKMNENNLEDVKKCVENFLLELE